MSSTPARTALLAFALVLGGCSYSSEVLWPGMVGDALLPPEAATARISPAARPASDAQPASFAGRKAEQLEADLEELRQAVAQYEQRRDDLEGRLVLHQAGFAEARSALGMRLQNGGGGPAGQAELRQAQAQLERAGIELAGIGRLRDETASGASRAAWLIEASRAAHGLAGASEEEHRRLLSVEDGSSRAATALEQLLGDLDRTAEREEIRLAEARAEHQAMAARLREARPMQAAVGEGRRPLVSIRFKDPAVAYEQPLYEAVRTALERRPAARFEVVGVAPAQADTAPTRRNMEQVMRTLAEIGLPDSRIDVAAVTDPALTASEVHLYLR